MLVEQVVIVAQVITNYSITAAVIAIFFLLKTISCVTAKMTSDKLPQLKSNTFCRFI
jgi:hypothetical protein